MCARSHWSRKPRCCGVTLIELTIVISVIGVIAAMYTEYEQQILQERLIDQAAVELQRVIDAAMAYQAHEGFWPIDDCTYDAYIAAQQADCNRDGTTDSRDINGLQKLIESGYLSDHGFVDAAGFGYIHAGSTLFASSFYLQPVHEVSPAILSGVDDVFTIRYHTTAYWQIVLPGNKITLPPEGFNSALRIDLPNYAQDVSSHPGGTPGLSVRYTLPGGSYGCYARDIAHRISGAKVIRETDVAPIPPTQILVSPRGPGPQVPRDLTNCSDGRIAMAIEVLLRRWEPPSSLPVVSELHFDTVFAPQVQLSASTGGGVPMLLDAANTGELRLRAVVDSAADIATTDAMIQFAKAQTHASAPLGGIVTLRGVDEGHLGVMSGFVPGGTDAQLPTLASTGTDHQHLSSLVFERPDGTHIGLLSADLLSYYDASSVGDLAFSDRAISLSAGDAARASRHAGWRARISEVAATTMPFSPAASLAQADSLGLSLYNVRNYELGGARIYGGRMTIMPAYDFYSSFSSSPQLYFAMDSEDAPPLSIADEAYQHPGEGIQLNELTVIEGLSYDPPAGDLNSAGVLRAPALGGSQMRVPLVGAGASHSSYPVGFALSPATGIDLQLNANSLSLSYILALGNVDLELHEASLSLSSITLSTLDFTVNGRDGLFGESATQSLDGGIDNVTTLACAAGNPARCPTP